MKAAWNVFGDSYRYRAKYNEYRKSKMLADKEAKKAALQKEKPGEQKDQLNQIMISDFEVGG